MRRVALFLLFTGITVTSTVAKAEDGTESGVSDRAVPRRDEVRIDAPEDRGVPFSVSRRPSGIVEKNAAAVLAAEQSPASTGNPQRIVGLVVGGGGLVASIAGVLTGFAARGAYTDGCTTGCPASPAQAALAHELAIASRIEVVAGGALTVAGVVVFLTAPSPHSSPKLAVRPARTGMGLSVWAVF